MLEQNSDDVKKKKTKATTRHTDTQTQTRTARSNSRPTIAMREYARKRVKLIHSAQCVENDEKKMAKTIDK